MTRGCSVQRTWGPRHPEMVGWMNHCKMSCSAQLALPAGVEYVEILLVWQQKRALKVWCSTSRWCCSSQSTGSEEV